MGIFCISSCGRKRGELWALGLAAVNEAVVLELAGLVAKSAHKRPPRYSSQNGQALRVTVAEEAMA